MDGPPPRRKSEAAASASPARLPLIIVILSEVRRSVATKRESKDLLSSLQHDYVRESSPLHTNIINAHHEPIPMSRMLKVWIFFTRTKYFSERIECK
jgi:hypothetical protein